MSSLIYTFSDVYTNVSEYLGLGSSPTGTNLTKVKNIVYRGYIKFLTAIHPTKGKMHKWSFLTQEATLVTSEGVWRYLLPANYWMMSGDMLFYSDSGYGPVTKTTSKEIKLHRSGTTYNSYACKYAIIDGPYDPAIPQRKEVLFYPTPNGDHSLQYEYLIMPDKPVNDNDYFIGGAEVSECIRLCALAVAEQEEDEFAGQMANRCHEMLAQMVLEDELKNVPDSMGRMDCLGKNLGEFRDLYQVRALNAISEVYGVSI